MLLFLQFFFSILGLSIATFTDLKERIISDKLTYGLIVAGLGISALRAFIEKDSGIFLVSAVLAISTFIAGYFLWKLGVWAGGDVKLMTGLAALNPFNLFEIGKLLNIQNPLLIPITLPIFPLTLFIFSIFAMLPYGSLISFKKLVELPELKKKTLGEFKSQFFSIVLSAAFIAGLNSVFVFLKFDSIAFFLLLFLFFLAFGRNPLILRIEKFSSVFLIAFALYLDFFAAIFSFLQVFLVFAFVFAILKLYFLSRVLLKKDVLISELEEGMIPAQSIYELDGGIIVKAPPIEMKTIINYLKDNKLAELQSYINPAGREIVSAKKARGLTVEEIDELKKLRLQKKIDGKIGVKFTAPFVPAILIAYIALNLVGDLLWHLVF